MWGRVRYSAQSMTQARSRVSCGKCSALHRGTLCVLVVPAVVAAHRMCCLSLVALRGRAGSGLCPASRRDATRLQLGFPRGTHSRGHRCSDCVGHHPWARHRSSRPRIGGIGPRRRAAVTAGFGIGTCEQFVGQWACSLSPSGTQPPYMMSPLLLRTGNTRLKLQTFHPGHARNVHRRASIVDGRRAMELRAARGGGGGGEGGISLGLSWASPQTRATCRDERAGACQSHIVRKTAPTYLLVVRR